MQPIFCIAALQFFVENRRRVKERVILVGYRAGMRLLLPAISVLLAAIDAAGAAPVLPFATPAGAQCRPAIAAAERAEAIPGHLLAAIGRIESGRKDPSGGGSAPWPWTINAAGQGSFFDTKAQAVEAVRALQASGVRSIDVGCMQVNLMHHPAAFANLEQAFDPAANAAYAARFLNQLYAQTKDWPQAVGQYHSATPELGGEYRRKVLAVWPEEQRLTPTLANLSATPGTPATLGAPALASAWAATMNRASVTRGPMMPVASNVATPVGRGLSSYRSMPIQSLPMLSLAASAGIRGGIIRRNPL
jgi:hypothetical protein